MPCYRPRMMAEAIRFFFDFLSPYTYLASTQIDGVASRAGRKVAWVPALLGAIMKETGNQPPALVVARGEYMAKDLVRWSVHYGVPFRFSSAFPFNSMPALRATCALLARAPETAPAFIHR